MSKLMEEMTALHAPTPGKPKIKGQLIKNGRKPKGSINVPPKKAKAAEEPKATAKPTDPRLNKAAPRDPRIRTPVTKTEAFKRATRLNRSRLFSLSSDDEVSINKTSKLSMKNYCVPMKSKLVHSHHIKANRKNICNFCRKNLYLKIYVKTGMALYMKNSLKNPHFVIHKKFGFFRHDKTCYEISIEYTIEAFRV